MAALTMTMVLTPTSVYSASVAECSRKYNLDQIDVWAVIMLESGGNPNLVHEFTRATGLMQVVPSDTPDETIRPYFVGRPTSEQLKDPAINLEWGCKILSRYIKRCSSLKFALFFYSGGTAWDSIDDFDRLYYQPFLRQREYLRDGH